MTNFIYIGIFAIILAFISAVSSSALHNAVRSGSMFDLRKVLRTCTDLNPKDSNDQTPLHVAVSKGQMLLTNILIQAGVDLNAKDKNDQTPLLIAVSNGEMLISKNLIQAKADVDLKDKSGRSPLIIATGKGELLISLALIEAKADVKATDENARTPLHLCILAQAPVGTNMQQYRQLKLKVVGELSKRRCSDQYRRQIPQDSCPDGYRYKAEGY
ncbi:ankyrin repeats (3 copies) domain-containing protein [Ditylenchus destructor]|nr:ankyrin repeats (3 copies) domain-containing protein [Ditylenchus destructor]